MQSIAKKLVAFSTSWGTRFGGINSFNRDLLTAFSGVAFREVETVCVVLWASREDIDQAARDQVKLISIGCAHEKAFSPALEPSVWDALTDAGVVSRGAEIVWLGHDRITGEIALTAASRRGGKSALIHHMSYGTYEAFAENSALGKAKDDEQRELFRRADIALAVGPLLRDALADMLDCDNVSMLVPGLPEINVRKTPRTFKCFLSGRLSDDAQKIKQAHLGVAAFGTAIREADINKALPDALRGANEPKLVLRGVDFEKNEGNNDPEAELDLKRFAESYSKRAFPFHALPFTTDREQLFADLSSASLAMMPSWHEGFGLVAWEAIGAGVPLIVSMKSGVYRLLCELDDGVYLSLITAIDVAGTSETPYFLETDCTALAQAVINIGKDPIAFKQKAGRLRETLAKRFTWAECARQLVASLGWTLVEEEQSLPLKSPLTAAVQNQGARHLITVPRATWKPGSGLSESQLLRAEEAVIPFDPKRLPFLEEQMEWATGTPYPIAVRLLAGAGGVGKTRLALELCQSLSEDGWHVGFLGGDCVASQANELVRTIADSSAPMLVVLDYAETRQPLLLGLLRGLQLSQPSNAVRVLLLARDGGEWWNLLPSKDSQCESLLSGMASTGPFIVPKLHDSEPERQQAYQLALRTFASRLNVIPPDHSPRLEESHFAHPLYVQMAALIALRGERPKTAEALTRALVGHERRYWRKALASLGPDESQIEQHAAHLMAIATLAGGVVTVRDIEKIWESIGGERTLLKPLFKALTPLYPGRQGLEGWRPDVLGEALIAQVLLSDNGSVLLSAVLRQNDRKIRQSSLTVLGRMLRNRSEIAQIVEDVLVENFVSCADDIVAASLETPSTLPIIAEHAFSRLRSSDQCKAADLLARHVNFDIPHLSRLDVVVSRVLAERVKRSLKKQTIESKVKYGTALLNLAIALQRDGKIEEASQVALDALGIRKRLAEINPERFESNLATALSVYSGVLGEQGKNELAVAYVLQSLEIRRRLAKAGTPKLEAELAVSLTNYSTFLDRLGRVEESAHVGEEALETCEKLAESNPELYGDDLAIALLNHAVSLSNRGQTDEAVESAKRAVAIHEKLAHAKPERFEYSHARSLRGCASFLEDQGKIEEAIASCTQALAIFEKLAAAKPERFQGDLARTMSSYSSYLAENGQTEAAINAAKRALDIRTTLAEVKPERFEAELATSLINYSNLLAKRGYVEQALEISQRGLDIRQKMSEEYPMQHEPGIGVALGNRASYFANVGRWEDAVHQEERALEIFRRCAERTPALYAFHQEVSRTALSFWKWLWDRSPVRPLEEGIMTVSANWRDSLVLQYQLRCFNALATPDASLVESALAAWAKLNCVQQHNWRESYFALAVIAEAVLGDGNAPPHWREAFNQYLQRNNGWMPFWIGEVAERSGIDMGIR